MRCLHRAAPVLLGLIVLGCGASPTPSGPPPSAIRTYIEAGILAERGDLTAAAARYDDVTAIDPTSFEVWLGAAHARIQLKEWDAARERAERAWRLAPNHPRVATALGQILLGKGDLESAARTFGAVVEDEPDYTQAWTGLAETQLRQGQIDAAVSSLERIAALHPESPKTWLQIDSLGWVLYRQGHLPDAERALWRAFKMAPHQTSAALHLIEVLWVSGQRDRARAQVKRVLKSLDPKQQKMFRRKWRRIKKEHR